MIAIELISQEVAPLKTSDSGEFAISQMAFYHVRHLPIVNNEQLLGVISEDEILNEDTSESVGSYRLGLYRPYSYDREHIFEVMSKMANSNLTVIPVVDKEENYLGLITLEKLLQFYAESFAFKEPGSIIVLETTRLNYMLSEIARIAEGEGAIILSSFVTTEPETNTLLVTIKLNIHDLGRIIASYQRFNYTIRGSFSEEDYVDVLKERLDALMLYLNV